MEKLMETVTIRREVPSHIADLINFAKYCECDSFTDEELIKLAYIFWEDQHGED